MRRAMVKTWLRRRPPGLVVVAGMGRDTMDWVSTRRLLWLCVVNDKGNCNENTFPCRESIFQIRKLRVSSRASVPSTKTSSCPSAGNRSVDGKGHASP